VEVVLRVIVYLILAASDVEETTVEEAVTLTVKELLATPDKLTGTTVELVVLVTKFKPVISECLYCVPEAMFAIGDGLKLLGPGPMIRNT
jgi:hypothetical protein